MEFGKIAFELDQIKPGDLDATLNFVIVAKGSFGSAVALRNFLEENPHYKLVHFSMSQHHIYGAKAHELTAQKKKELGIDYVRQRK